MLKWLFSIVLVLHGLIHLLGFIKALRPNTLPELQVKIRQTEGYLWLSTATLFLLTFFLLLFSASSWWIAGFMAGILSQILVIKNWQATKFATLFNVIVILVCFLYSGSLRFEYDNRKIEERFTSSEKVQHKTPALSTSAYPFIIKRWIEKSHLPDPNGHHFGISRQPVLCV